MGRSQRKCDHLVPYPGGNEEKNSGAFGDQTLKEWKAEALSINLDDQKKSTTGADLLEPKVNECPKYEEDECLEESLNLESWPAILISSSTKSEQVGASNNLTEIPEPNTSTEGETPRRHGSSEIFQNQLDDEQGDLVNYGWDTIGSFDDLDRIFSNDDPIYGHASLSNVDELWSSSKDVTSNLDICGTWSTSTNQFQQFDSQYAPAMGQPYPPFLIPPNRQLIGPQSSQYNNFPGSVFCSPMYVNMGTQYPPMVGLPQHRSCEGSHHQAISQPLPMTPQEKIEKLRRRQQMRAMLAIQKQQEQFNNHASSAETPSLNGANSEVDEMMPVLPSRKSFEKDGHTGDHSVEDSILCQLQHIVGKLDIE